MIRKIKSYYRAFGFWQTVLKLFRYANERIHTDKVGIYTPTRKENESIIQKSQKVWIFSDEKFSETSGKTASKFALVFNKLGCDVRYYCLCERTERLRHPPLCLYECFSSDQMDALNFENSVVVLDTVCDLKLALKEKAENQNCALIDASTLDCPVSEELCAKVLNKLNQKTKCSECFFANISVVILNYNNKNVIFNCLDTLIKFNERYGYEIIVVDNQSTDGSYELIAERYKDVKLYRNAKNGCSSGRNLGIAHATKEYVIFLDSDQWVTRENWLDVYLEILEKQRNVGAIGWTGGWFNRKGYSFHTVNNFSYGYMPPKALCRSDIGYLGTGGMMVKKSLLDEIGGFDLNYDPTCYEDTDLSLEIRHRGKELYYCPYLGVGHLPHQTTKSGSDAHEKLIKEKGDYFVNKWTGKNKKLLKYVK